MQALFMSFMFFLFFFVLMGSVAYIGEFYISISLLSSVPLDVTFIIDLYGVSFGAVVSLISGSVMIFSSYYMDSEIFKRRFSSVMTLFVLSMYTLLFSGGFISLMVGWDGLGVTSFLLVVYYQSKSSVSAGMLTSLTNRLGDILFMVCMGVVFGCVAFDFLEILEGGVSALFVFMLVLGCMTKSAQMPFSAWLPAAMAAPTPVSTLVHSSTLVTAGLFVVIRFSSGLEGVAMYTLLASASLLTCVMASSCATLEPDLKKIVAFSTLSQLGLMGLSLSFSHGGLAFFHLVVHALFKALMFMCVGAVIMAGFGVQDSRFFSGAYYKMPVTSMWLSVSCLSLSGFPFMSGFFSKDLMMEGLLGGFLSSFGVLLVYISCLLTSSYSFRLVSLLFWEDGGQPFSVGCETALHYVATSFLGVGSVAGAVFFQALDISFNPYCSSDWMVKLGVFISMVVGVGAVPLMEISFLPLIPEFVMKMFFLKSLSGSFISGGFMKVGDLAEKVDLNMEMYMGEGAARKSSGYIMKSNGLPVHWGVMFFGFYYGLAVLIILYLFI